MKYNNIINVLLLSTQALLINADKVTFKVLAVNGTPTLNINGAQQQMTLDKYPLYKAEVDVDNFPVTYSYSIDGEAESFQRKREKGADSLNEFFGREQTVIEHPKLPRAYKAFEYQKTSKLFDDTHVATIIVKTDNLEELYQNFNDDEYVVPAEVVYASPYTVKTFKNAKLGISGQSTRMVPKLSFKIKGLKDENDKELYGRSTIKLRAEHMDPSFLRDKLYGDILNSLGVPAVQNKYARLFINGEAIGFYDISDSISSDRYLRETYNEGKKFSSDNYVFKADFCPTCEGGAAYGDLGYYGDDPANVMYSIYSNKGADKDTVDENTKIAQCLIPLLKDIDSYKNGTSQKMPFDVDQFLRYMAMEFLSGAVDNYWNKPGNFYVIKDVSRDQWYFHDSDFHYTFGCGGDSDAMMNTPISQYPPLLEENVGKERAPLDGIRSRQENEAKFNEIFKRLISTSFNPSALYPRMESLATLIKEDAYWDFTLPKTNPNPTADLDMVYTNENFDINVYSEQPSTENGNVPIITFINTRLNNIAQELGIQIPATYESDLGFVENPDSSKSGAMGKYSWSIYSALIVLFVTLML